ncbi:hypothetical protein [Halomonas smyrnensis]|uniref:hypothetical protein n=1 Tax=Halomonas smyrnensis TaxID=720605 RepID=UPI00031F80EB|nr:hypothetical protein [Halomonas smyrnensis]
MLEQVALLRIPTLGMPASVAAMIWIEDITDETRSREAVTEAASMRIASLVGKKRS